MAEKWTKISVPSSCWMNPYPLLLLNHFPSPWPRRSLLTSRGAVDRRHRNRLRPARQDKKNPQKRRLLWSIHASAGGSRKNEHEQRPYLVPQRAVLVNCLFAREAHQGRRP